MWWRSECVTCGFLVLGLFAVLRTDETFWNPKLWRVNEKMTLEESNNETLTRAEARGLEDAHMREKFRRWREELEAAEPSRVEAAITAEMKRVADYDAVYERIYCVPYVPRSRMERLRAWLSWHWGDVAFGALVIVAVVVWAVEG